MGDFLYICVMEELVKDTCLYMHTRKSDGRIIYIGIGSEKRPNDKTNRGRFWKNMIKNHNGFDVVILKTGMSWKEACDLEIKMIAFYGRIKPSKDNPNYGCLVNMTDGGDGTKGCTHSEESKQKRRERMTGEKNHMFGRFGEKNHMFNRTGENNPLFGIRRNKEVILKISGKNHHMYGKKNHELSERNRSEESRQRQRERMTGKSNPMFGRNGENHPNYGKTGEDNGRSRKVICVVTNKIYTCIKDAAEDNGVNLSTLRGYLRGNRPNKTSLRYM
jgi:hypothetical protein